MMNLSNLKAPTGSRKNRKRVGRGHATGQGKTSGKGHKGQKARSGTGKPGLGFEGGQMPLHRRIPKFGFKNIFKINYNVLNLDDLSKMNDGSTVDVNLLKKMGLCKGSNPLKILGRGKLDKKLTVKAKAFSQSAKQAIEKAGGQVVVE